MYNLLYWYNFLYVIFVLLEDQGLPEEVLRNNNKKISLKKTEGQTKWKAGAVVLQWEATFKEAVPPPPPPTPLPPYWGHTITIPDIAKSYEFQVTFILHPKSCLEWHKQLYFYFNIPPVLDITCLRNWTQPETLYHRDDTLLYIAYM